MSDLDALEQKLKSPNKDVRLKALKLVLRHPDATPVQMAQCLCSMDNRDFEFLDEFDLGPAMRQSWLRLKGTDDQAVYDYLQELYESNPSVHKGHVEHILELIKTSKAKETLHRIRYKNIF